MDWTKIKKDLIYWVKQNSGITESGRHIWAYQNAPQPEPPYVTLNITNGPTKIGNTDSVLYNKNNEKFCVTGVRTFTLEINVYGRDALNIATSIKLSIERDDTKNYFRGVDLTPGISSPSITNTTEFIDTIYEERTFFELTFMTSYILESQHSCIQEVRAKGINEMEKGKNNELIIGGNT